MSSLMVSLDRDTDNSYPGRVQVHIDKDSISIDLRDPDRTVSITNSSLEEIWALYKVERKRKKEG